MPGTVRKIIERIKEKRSGGNSVVALTVETRLVLQGFDPQRFEYDTPDDARRLARIAEIADEMQVDASDLLETADVEPDADAAAAPPPRPQGSDSVSESARTSAAAAAAALTPRPTSAQVSGAHPLHNFRQLSDSLLTQVGDGVDGSNSGAGFDVLVKSSVLMGLYSIRKDAVFCDLLPHCDLFQWFLGLTPESARFDAGAFRADRERALISNRSRRFFDKLVAAAGRDKLFKADVFQVNAADFKNWMTPRDKVR